MKKRVLTFSLVLSLILTMLPITGLAASDEAIQAAESLHALGLFGGVGNNADGTPNFDLDRAPTRQEAITMLVRLLGKEEEAKAGTWETPFVDVDDWAKPYVGYAYTNGLTTGTGVDTFGGNDTVTATQYLTFILRALGYTSGSDFQWDKAWELSDKIELTDGRYNAETTAFTRGDVAIVSENMLSATGKENDITVLAQLVTAGAVTETAADSYLHPIVKAKSLILDQASMELTVGLSKTIIATVLPEETADKTLTWTSSDPTVATVIDGKVEALKVGTTTITVKTANGISAACEVTVKEQEVTEITLSQTSASIEIGKSVTLTATVKPDNATNKTVTWESSNTSVATVQDGVVRGISAGSATITAKSGNGKTATCTINVVEPTLSYSGSGDKVITGVSVSGGSYYIEYTHDGKRNFIVKVYPEGSRTQLVANEIGQCSGQVALESWYLSDDMIEVKADGNWTIELKPVTGTTTTNMKGTGVVVTGVFTVTTSRAVISTTHTGKSNFIVKIRRYDIPMEGLITNEIGTYSGQKVIELTPGNQYFMYVDADGDWTIDFGLGDSVTTYTQPTISNGGSSSSEESASSGSNTSPENADKRFGYSDINTLKGYANSANTSINSALQNIRNAGSGIDAVRVAYANYAIQYGQLSAQYLKSALNILTSKVEIPLSDGTALADKVQEAYDVLLGLDDITVTQENVRDVQLDIYSILGEAQSKILIFQNVISQLLSAYN